MSKPTYAQRFKAKAAELMPHQDGLQNIDDSINDLGTIDEVLFRESEYLGGMAAVIFAVLSQEA